VRGEYGGTLLPDIGVEFEAARPSATASTVSAPIGYGPRWTWAVTPGWSYDLRVAGQEARVVLGVRVATGRVVRFDGMRGYGFIAPDSGGEDIFLHANDLLIPEEQLRSGLAVEFEVQDGDRGLKASNIKLAQGAETPAVPARGVAAPAAKASAPLHGTEREPVRAAEGDYPMCDVLTGQEYSRVITELLLKAAPSLTADQILLLRHELVKFSESHGWIED
jgi:cold shock protein